MKQLIFLLICLLSLLQYRLWLGDNNLSEYVLLQTQIAGQEQSNGKLVARNQILKEEIIDLKSGTEAIEERARNELGMVKDGETFYRVVGSELRERNPFNR
ncbi:MULTISPECIES: cell division protein FtsB [unclassified Shewanella]|jgi:cell division protein FtsB|uniref:cell division protein FtsB n=1 Tax=unclassified Shewanella TaxID=196818 RepID=UPI000C342591|nr:MULTISPECIES: cell division protein FtsB [unclassified Shewanella]MBB1361372.1 cell division protein FtsB [Shewanella sp. SR44-4]MBO1894589.1 cell division protein FtsB [Shewanella sp. BF02_Schw]PKH33328.1 cell division protein FtsB [Shewanella sp. ALD9]QHS12641.1 cell division protein FtsB [Shewanella sp. Arc9-LZ]|tara:strand:+ start:1088 stop:1390 length:303 start_codon:yes stop_codon:yes gene_type:complete